MTMPLTFGDLARTLSLRSSTTQLKTQMTTLSEELVTGRAADLTKKVGGDFSVIGGLDRSLGLQQAWATAGREAAAMAAAQQNALSAVAPRLHTMGMGLIANDGSLNPAEIRALMESAEEEFSLLVDTLNTTHAGRAVFAGTATQGPSLADAETILADLALAVGAETTAAGVMAAADAWANAPGGGFETVAFSGSFDDLAPFSVAEGESVRLETSAADAELRQSVKQVALTALMARGIPALSGSEQADLYGRVGGEMLNTSDDLTYVQARIGFAETRIQDALVRTETNSAALQIARDAVIGVDSYATASKLQQTEAQLQAIYTITSRMSQLSLASVLR